MVSGTLVCTWNWVLHFGWWMDVEFKGMHFHLSSIYK